jgi:hypothetical protein
MNVFQHPCVIEKEIAAARELLTVCRSLNLLVYSTSTGFTVKDKRGNPVDRSTYTGVVGLTARLRQRKVAA